MTQGIYKLIFPSDKIYIGKSKNIEMRWNTHKKDSIKLKYPLHLAIIKYGWDTIVKEIIEIVSDDLLSEREKYWIAFYDSSNKEKGYNLTIGGTGGDTFSKASEENKEKRRANSRKPCSERVKLKLSQIMKDRLKTEPHPTTGKIPWNKGKTGTVPWNKGLKYKLKNPRVFTEEERKRISERFKAPKSEEQKEKLRQANVGKKLSEETKNKMSRSRRGQETKIYICPYCDKVGKSCAMLRWHFDNCKLKGKNE